MTSSCSGVDMNRYRKGINAKKQAPINSQTRRPQRSDKMPKIGLRKRPVTVETDTISPRNAPDAPKAAAKMGSSGVLPI